MAAPKQLLASTMQVAICQQILTCLTGAPPAHGCWQVTLGPVSSQSYITERPAGTVLDGIASSMWVGSKVFCLQAVCVLLLSAVPGSSMTVHVPVLT